MKRLGKKQRRLLLAVELHRRQHGQGPLWRELREALETPKATLAFSLQSLRVEGYVAYTDNEPRSLRVTQQGLAAAVNGKGQRPT